MLNAHWEMKFIDGVDAFSRLGRALGRRQVLLSYREALLKHPSKNNPSVEAVVLAYVNRAIREESLHLIKELA